MSEPYAFAVHPTPACGSNWDATRHAVHRCALERAHLGDHRCVCGDTTR